MMFSMYYSVVVLRWWMECEVVVVTNLQSCSLYFGVRLCAGALQYFSGKTDMKIMDDAECEYYCRRSRKNQTFLLWCYKPLATSDSNDANLLFAFCFITGVRCT